MKMSAKLKHSKPGQERNAAASQIETQPDPKDAKPSSGAEQAISLPPFPVLLQWLEYYHTRTGVWPEPESVKTPSSNQPKAEFLSSVTVPTEKPLLTLLPAK